MRFTEEELRIAKSVDLCAVASHLGYTVRRIGKYHTLKEMDSIRIYNRTHWFRWSRRYEKGENGGSQIDFLRVFAGMDVKEAVFWLIDFTGYRRLESKETLHGVILPNGIAAEERKEFVLPEYAGSNAYLYNYLVNQREIAKEVVDHFVKAGILYEAKNYHNVVFVGTDASGTPKFASMRGVFDRSGRSFKCDVEGNDKQYGFHLHREACIEIVVFEAAIDLLSYMTIYPDKQCDLLALGMVADAPLDRYLKDYPDIRRISFCLDNDEAGQKAEQQMMEKYKGLGYSVTGRIVPLEYKDVNEWLVSERKNKMLSNPIEKRFK